ncbi:hypothetical protein [Streptomyces aureocirculatus]|uniref:hypothetical protein n=1 Tax=Streptomyces aureocirculatus TaxID=67275 RepID=UPI000A479331|nr:hypothetical protein [Streptomyces aureocirculatus]
MAGTGSLAYQFADTYDNGRCSARSAPRHDLLEQSHYKFRVCIVRIGQRPHH